MDVDPRLLQMVRALLNGDYDIFNRLKDQIGGQIILPVIEKEKGIDGYMDVDARDLSSFKLGGISLCEFRFTHCVARNQCLSGAKLTDCVLRRCSMDLQGVRSLVLESCRFEGCIVKRAVMRLITLSDCRFTHDDAEERTVFEKDCDFEKGSLSGCSWPHVHIKDAKQRATAMRLITLGVSGPNIRTPKPKKAPEPKTKKPAKKQFVAKVTVKKSKPPEVAQGG